MKAPGVGKTYPWSLPWPCSPEEGSRAVSSAHSSEAFPCAVGAEPALLLAWSQPNHWGHWQEDLPSLAESHSAAQYQVVPCGSLELHPWGQAVAGEVSKFFLDLPFSTDLVPCQCSGYTSSCTCNLVSCMWLCPAHGCGLDY